MNVKKTLNSFKILDIKIGSESMREDSINLAKIIKPEWNVSKMKTKLFTNGTTNQLIGCYLEEHESDMILIRIYGANTHLFIDRSQEIDNLQLMNKYYLSPPLFASFHNGICYGYNEGIVINREMVKEEIISLNICKMMAKMHSIAFHENKNKHTRACLFVDLRKYLNLLLPSSLDNINLDQNMPDMIVSLTIEGLKKEADQLEAELIQLESPIVFAHNDLLFKNIIYNPKNQSIFFIDYEYASYNFQAFDIANHFCEFLGFEDFDPKYYPEKSFQLKYLRNYLQFLNHYQSLSLKYQQNCDVFHESGDGYESAVTYQLNHSNHDNSHSFANNFHNGNINCTIDEQVNRLYIQVTKFSLAAHLFWGVWALLQSQFSSLDYDFKEYGLKRIREYYHKKHEILSLQF